MYERERAQQQQYAEFIIRRFVDYERRGRRSRLRYLLNENYAPDDVYI